MTKLDELQDQLHNVIIVGSGPAGHTAAIYTARACLEPLMFEGEMAAGVAAGGQLTTTTEVENFPGFPNGISGPELMMNIRQQSINSGAKIFTKTVDKVNFDVTPYEVTVGDKLFKAKTIIIATGATAKRLGIAGEDIYWQKGISACAVCDGALPMFRNQHLVVIGGGDTACEEANFLSKFASKVTLFVRRDELRASKVMQERTLANEKIEILWNTEALEAKGEKTLQSLRILNNKTNTESELETKGLFYGIGHEPNTGFLNGKITTDESGYIVVKEPGSTKTNLPGVFACGDVQDKIYRQAITAAGSGCMAAMDAEHYISSHA